MALADSPIQSSESAENTVARLQPLALSTVTDRHRRAQGATTSVADSGATQDGNIETMLWLLRYPLLRAHDLATLQGLSVSATAARLLRIRAEGLARTLPAGLLGRRAAPLYALTLVGLGALAERYGPEVWDVARRMQATPSGLLRLIPRLPGLLTTQSFVLALVTQAPVALRHEASDESLPQRTSAREQQACWSWTRHTRLRALDQLNQGDGAARRTKAAFHADAVLRLDLNSPAVSDASSPHEADSPSSRSYRMLILWDSGLEPLAVIRRKLQALLRIRKTYEQRGRLAAFPALLVLASNARRAEQWQAQALRLATERWLTHALLGGALALEDARDHIKEFGWEARHASMPFPPALLDTVNPWQAKWRSFARRQTQLLIALLQSDTSPDLSPSSVGMRTAQRRTALQTRNLTRQRAQTASNPTVKRDEQGEERVRLARAALRLEARSLRLLALLYQHPYLSTDQLATIVGVRSASAERMLRSLAQADLTQSAQWASGQHVMLSDVGVALLAQCARLPGSSPRRRALADSPSAGTDGSPRVVWRYRHEAQALARVPEHTDGMYRFFTTLLSACAAERARGHDAALCWWETGSVCARAYRAYPGWQVIRPDGAGECHVDGWRTQFWLEWDRSTMGLRDLRAKFAAYARYVSSQEWRAEGYTALPLLLVVTSSEEQGALIEQALRATFQPTVPLAVYLTTESSLLAPRRGPLAPIWRSFGDHISPLVHLKSPLWCPDQGA